MQLRITKLTKGDNILELDNMSFGIMQKEIEDRKLSVEIIKIEDKKEVIQNADKEEG